MAKYTIELKTLVEQKYKLNLENYPIFDETYRDTLNNKIINHYYFHEIGFETPDRFNHYLGTTMSEIMPYYNQLYESAKLEIEPLVTDNFTETTTRTGDETTTTNGVNQSQVKSNTENKQVNDLTTTNNVTNNSEGTNTSNATNTKYQNDTPQTPIKKNWISDDGFYASSVETGVTNGTDNSETTQTSNGTTTNTGNVTNNYSEDTINSNFKDDKEVKNRNLTDTKTTTGSKKSQAELLKLYRDTFINIDLMVIGELKNLFMGVF